MKSSFFQVCPALVRHFGSLRVTSGHIVISKRVSTTMNYASPCFHIAEVVTRIEPGFKSAVSKYSAEQVLRKIKRPERRFSTKKIPQGKMAY
jgi:hypothetical protein